MKHYIGRPEASVHQAMAWKRNGEEKCGGVLKIPKHLQDIRTTCNVYLWFEFCLNQTNCKRHFWVTIRELECRLELDDIKESLFSAWLICGI